MDVRMAIPTRGPLTTPECVQALAKRAEGKQLGEDW